MLHYVTPLLYVNPAAGEISTQDAVDLMKLEVRAEVPSAAQAREVLLALGFSKEHVEQQIRYCMMGEWVSSNRD